MNVTLTASENCLQAVYQNNGLLSVDSEHNVLRGVVVLQVGNLNEPDDRPLTIDSVTLDQVLSIASRDPKGIRARWEHPTLDSDRLSSFLGRWRNFRKTSDGLTLLADLHISKTVMNSNGRGKWVLGMAEEDPSAIGVSMAPNLNKEEMQRDLNDQGLYPVRVNSLSAFDIVDEPAATRGGLFGDSTPFSVADATDYFSRQGKNPEEAPMPDKNEANAAIEELQGRVDGMASSINEIKAMLSKQQPTEEEVELAKKQELSKLERERSIELFSLAENAGFEDYQARAEKWINSDLSVEQVKSMLPAMMSASNPLSKDAGAPADDPDASIKAEYQSQLSIYQAAGVSEEDFVASMKATAAQSEI